MKPSIDATYLLTLEHRPERTSRGLARCEAVGLTPEVFFGSTPSDLEKTGFTRSPGLPLPVAATTLSHRRILEDIARRDLDCALVLEDDVQFAVDFVSELERVFRFLDPKFGMVQLGWLPGPAPLTRRDLLRFRVLDDARLRRAVSAVAPPSRQIGVEQNPLKAGSLQWGAHCYLVSGAMAREMLPCIGPHLYTAIDLFYPVYAEFSEAPAFRTKVPMASQDATMGSDISVPRLAIRANLRRFRGR